MTHGAVFIAGTLTMAYAIIAVFFLRFWSQTRDRLFAFFASAFALLAIQRAVVALATDTTTIYVLRLIAFTLIIIAIVDKNRGH